ncbi:o-succinylbenzoate synthase [Camelliibacillus cellulosilyticus]|uniref:o-succinylbenzoate synthase n=1 Tax=Camelliibacillus cellulosilyticus TaxID=2174486 RepID=A0ABV9GTL6_9BACL
MPLQPVRPVQIVLRKLNMRMRNPFTTSFGTEQDKTFCVLKVVDESGKTGWGESVAVDLPLYNEETTITNQHILEDIIIPHILGKDIGHPDEVSRMFHFIRRNRMAIATMETAIWDLFAKVNQMPLYQLLGGENRPIEVGVSIGIHDVTKELLNKIEEKLQAGAKKIKLKIRPGQDVEVIKEVRKVYPDIPLMADANSAYTLKDIDIFKKLDAFNLMMIEQPLGYDDLIDHSRLQKQIQTPICLDESIISHDNARKAIELGSCKVINIKIGRVGGLSEAKSIHDVCAAEGIPVWCGGMLEAGIGRAHNIALSTLSNFTLPGDTGPSRQYWEKDIIEPEVVVENGMVRPPDKPGIGYAIDHDALDAYTIYERIFER